MQQKADTTLPYIQRFMCPQSFHFSFAFTQLLILIARFIVFPYYSEFSEYYATAGSTVIETNPTVSSSIPLISISNSNDESRRNAARKGPFVITISFAGFAIYFRLVPRAAAHISCGTHSPQLQRSRAFTSFMSASLSHDAGGRV